MKKYIGIIAFFGLTLAYIWGLKLFTPKPKSPTEGIPHNYYHPNVQEDLYPGAIHPPGNKGILYDTIFQESIEDTILVPIEDNIEMNCGDSLDILSAIIFVESCNNDSAYRASEDAVGCLQIRKTMVNDVNRILKRKKSQLRFTYNDRWDRNKSIQMFEIYCDHYNLTTAEEIARCWNGGPRGINNPATVRYWEKVKDKINS